MVAKSWAQGSVAGIDLSVSGDPVLCHIIDGANLQARRFVNNRISADGHVHTQSLNIGERGAKFGLKFDSLPIDMFKGIIEAVNDALDNSESIAVSLEDDFQSVDRDCVPDGSDWLQYPDQTTNESFVDNVIMRFVTT